MYSSEALVLRHLRRMNQASKPMAARPTMMTTHNHQSAAGGWMSSGVLPVSVVVSVDEVLSVPVGVESVPVEVESLPVEVESLPVEVESLPVEVESLPVEVESVLVEEPEPVESVPVEVESEPVLPEVVESEPVLVESVPVELVVSARTTISSWMG